MAETFRYNEERRRYELEVDGLVAFADTRREGAKLVIPHVEAPPALRGTGAADRLMQHVSRAAKADHLEIVPICSYAAMWMKRHA